MSHDTTQTQAKLDEVIMTVLNHLENMDPDTPEYSEVLDRLSRLRNIQITHEPEKEPVRTKESATMKDWIPAIGSFGGILTIVIFEGFGHTVTSKALSFASKVK